MSDTHVHNSAHANPARVAIVTGAASGIGRAIALALTRGGHHTVIADNNVDATHQVAAELGGLPCVVDLAEGDACRALVAQTVTHFGRVDILVNNAGYQHIAPIDEFPETVWNHMLAVMLTAPFLLTQAVWPHMKAQRWGRIVNIGSIHSVRASPFGVEVATLKRIA